MYSIIAGGIYGRYCIQKSNNIYDHLHLKCAIILL